MRYSFIHRTPVLSYYELTEEQIEMYHDPEDMNTEAHYVLKPSGEPLPLDEFMRAKGRIHGVMTTSNTSAYGVVLSSCGTEAVLVSVWW